MTTFAQVSARARKDPEFLARLIINPKKALSDAEMKLTSRSDVKRIEMFVRTCQEQIAGAGRVVGMRTVKSDWGIGMSCCNAKALFR